MNQSKYFYARYQSMQCSLYSNIPNESNFISIKCKIFNLLHFCDGEKWNVSNIHSDRIRFRWLFYLFFFFLVLKHSNVRFHFQSISCINSDTMILFSYSFFVVWDDTFFTYLATQQKKTYTHWMSVAVTIKHFSILESRNTFRWKNMLRLWSCVHHTFWQFSTIFF